MEFKINENPGKSDLDIKVDLDNIEKPKKKRGRPAKSKAPETSVDTVDLNDNEKEKLQQELLMLGEGNPDFIVKPINSKLSETVEQMSINELKARIRQAKRQSCAKLDDSVVGNVINLANQLSGSLLGCYDELDASTRKDLLLKDTTKDYLSLNILDYIPAEIKILGLYGSHLTSSYYLSQMKLPKQIPRQLPSPDLNMDKQEKLDEFKNKLEDLKSKLNKNID